jgi:3-oxoadipate enol-lactonase
MATVLGVSLGGMIGLTLALTHPKRISAVLCCAALAEMPQSLCDAWDKRKEAVLRRGMSAVVDDTIVRWLTPEFRAEHPERVEQVRTMILGTSPQGYAGCIEAIKRVDLLRHLPRISVPTVYAVGEMDGNSTPDAMRVMADATPGGALILIPRASHLPNIDNPAGFIEAIRGFLKL